MNLRNFSCWLFFYIFLLWTSFSLLYPFFIWMDFVILMHTYMLNVLTFVSCIHKYFFLVTKGIFGSVESLPASLSYFTLLIAYSTCWKRRKIQFNDFVFSWLSFFWLLYLYADSSLSRKPSIMNHLWGPILNWIKQPFTNTSVWHIKDGNTKMNKTQVVPRLSKRHTYTLILICYNWICVRGLNRILGSTENR